MQQDNWREILLMVDLAHRYNVDRMFFNKIQNWNTGIDFATQDFFKDEKFIEMLERAQKDPIARIWTLL